MNKAKVKIKRPKMPSWEVMMRVEPDRYGLRDEAWGGRMSRARFFTLHCLASVLGRRNLKLLAKQMKASGKVCICHCPVVRAPVFYLGDMKDYTGTYRGSYGDYPYVWNNLDAFIKKYPFPKIKGFRKAGGTWSSGRYGIGQYIQQDNTMNEPFIPSDYAYANKIIKALKRAGYKPRIKPYKLKDKNA